jgi:hypothetical protein
MVVAEHQIETPVVVQVGDGHGATILQRVAAHRSRDVRVPPLPDTLEQKFVLVAVPGVPSDELGTEKEALFVFMYVCDRTIDKR